MIGVTSSETRALVLFAHDGLKSSADKFSQIWKHPATGVLKIAKPASDCRGEVGNALPVALDHTSR